MATGAKLGYGTLLKKGNSASPEVFTTIAEVVSIGEFGSEAEILDVTNFDSAGGFKEYINGLKDGVELTVVANFLPNNATQGYAANGLIDDHNDGTTRNFRLELTPSLGVFRFSGIIRGWRATIGVAAAMQVTFRIKVSGLIDWVVA